MQSTSIIDTADGSMSVHRNLKEAHAAIDAARAEHIRRQVDAGQTVYCATAQSMTRFQFGPSVTECVVAIITTLHRIERREVANISYQYNSNPGFMEVELTEYGSSHAFSKPRKLAETSFMLAHKEAARDLYRFDQWLQKEWL